ncbi:flagellar biosynthesis regulator FlaF [Arenibaculum pallidiluteum]|uniref:flagellar biosynthesis regulator FlaF n=1 Tax=Arenibaculum pallidiluteum TaxID=2812559 RepID=UPI001A967ED8|nr:flagellar biosynthesis regulator FlaF [Arenibaculum pallidiluteum]
MNSKINAYRQAASMKTDYRSQEANLFKRITYALQQGKLRTGGMDLVRAASDNKLLWMGVINAVSDDANQLPPALRTQLITIGRAVIKEIDENITGNLDVDFLIEINNQIIEGLMSSAIPAVQPEKTAP